MLTKLPSTFTEKKKKKREKKGSSGRGAGDAEDSLFFLVTRLKSFHPCDVDRVLSKLGNAAAGDAKELTSDKGLNPPNPLSCQYIEAGAR